MKSIWDCIEASKKDPMICPACGSIKNPDEAHCVMCEIELEQSTEEEAEELDN